MNAVEPPEVPVALQPVAAEITAITSRFCAERRPSNVAVPCS
jgi:hypothetical protein